MDAKNLVSHTLRVELLEGRFLLSSAGSNTPVVNELVEPGPADGYDSRSVRVAAPPNWLSAYGPRSSAGHDVTGDNDNDNDGDEPTAAKSTTSSPVDSHSGVPAQLLNFTTADRDLGDRDEEIRPVQQLARDALSESTPQGRPDTIPATQTNRPVADGAANDGSLQIKAQMFSESADVTVVLGLSGGGRTSGYADVPNSPAQSPSGLDRTPITPAASGPPATGAAPDRRAVALDSGSLDWRDVFLDPLADIPVRETVALNLSAFRSETEALFAHLGDLGPDWSPALEWGEYLSFVAAVLLVGGGVYFARSANARARTDARHAFRTGPEDGR